MDFDWTYDMSGDNQDYGSGWDQGASESQGFDWGSLFSGFGDFGGGGFGGDQGGFADFGADYNAAPQYAAPQMAQYNAPEPQAAQFELPSAPDVPEMQAPVQAQPAQIWNEPAAATNGLGGQQGPGGRDEESWLSKLGKGALGMGMGVGTSALGNMVQGLMAPKQSNNSPLTQGGGQGAVPTALPGTQYTPATQPQYTPQALEPEQGTKASPLISGRPTSVKGSAGLKERNPNYGGFSLY